MSSKATWNLNIRLTTTPRCPRCGNPLHAAVTVIADNVAVCRQCFPTVLTLDQSHLCLITDPRLTDYFRISHGVHFYLPPRDKNVPLGRLWSHIATDPEHWTYRNVTTGLIITTPRPAADDHCHLCHIVPINRSRAEVHCSLCEELWINAGGAPQNPCHGDT